MRQCLRPPYGFTHLTSDPWMTAYIKQEIRARQKAYTTENMTQYRHLSNKIITLLKRAKAEYYASKIKSKRKKDPAKWHRSISLLVRCEEGIETQITMESVTALTMQLKYFRTYSLNLGQTFLKQ